MSQKQQQNTNDYGAPTTGGTGVIANAIPKALASLLKRYTEDTKRWKGKKMPDNVKEDRENKRSLIKRLKTGQW